MVQGATDHRNCRICKCEKRKDDESNDNNNDNSGEYFCTYYHVGFGIKDLTNPESAFISQLYFQKR